MANSRGLVETATEADCEFLSKLVACGGNASRHELGPQITQAENSTRQRCKRRGWVGYCNGFWFISNAGRAALLRAKEAEEASSG